MTQSLPSDSVNGECFSQCKLSRSAPGDSVSAKRVPGDSTGAKWLSDCRVISQYRAIHQIIQRPSGVTGAIGWRAFEFTNAQCNCPGPNVVTNAMINVTEFHDRLCPILAKPLNVCRIDLVCVMET